MKEIHITGSKYDITARELPNGTWHLFGTYKDADIDNLWCDDILATFEDADGALLDIIIDEERTSNDVIIDGTAYDFDAVVNLMDDNLREQVHAAGYYSPQNFVDAYRALHILTFGEDFQI